MINKNEDLSYITGPDGKETPIKVWKEFTNEEGDRNFIFYTDIDDNAQEMYVGEIVKMDDGTEEISDIEEEETIAYCESVFDEFMEELEANEDDECDCDCDCDDCCDEC